MTPIDYAASPQPGRTASRAYEVYRWLAAAALLALLVTASVSPAFSAAYKGRYCEGSGDVDFLRLIDQSFAFFHPTHETHNISMLYVPESDALSEGAAWGAWWIQNSYGPTYCALPFLQEPWLTALQHSQDFWYDNQGDGTVKGTLNERRPEGVAELAPPDGCLVDCAGPGVAIHKQGDGRWWTHDWGLEFTAAGVLLQAELLLISRDTTAMTHYIPKMERACNFIETRRDAKNNLFLAGPAANLLAPSYAGTRKPDGSFGEAYLAGLSVTYYAAVQRMAELFKLTGDREKQALYEHRAETTRNSLPQYLTDQGYFVKYIEQDGTRHGVLGQEKWGYFEVAPNVDAICFRAVDQARARKIYWQIARIPELRPNVFLITNYPGLDDTYEHWGTRETGGLWTYGMWVNGGVWATMEARALMAYYRLGKFEDVRRSALKSMEFADSFQFDAPLKDFGKTPWFDQNVTNFCYDALGIPAATVRGLFEYVYSADSLALYPHVPSSIHEYNQFEPVRWGPKRITLRVTNGGPFVKSLKVNGKQWPVAAFDHVVLPYDDLPARAQVELVTAGGWPAKAEPAAAVVPPTPAAALAELPDQMKQPFVQLSTMRALIAREPGADYERAYLDEALACFETYKQRAGLDAAGAYADVKPEKRTAILKLYEDAALNMHKGFGNVMKRYSASGDARQKRIGIGWGNVLTKHQ